MKNKPMDKEQIIDKDITFEMVMDPIEITINKQSKEYDVTDIAAKRALQKHYGNITTLDFVQTFSEMADKKEVVFHLMKIEGIGKIIANMLAGIVFYYKDAAQIVKEDLNAQIPIHDSGWSVSEPTRPQIYSEIVSWLYRNHEAYNSAIEWRQALIEFLADLLLRNSINES